MAEILIHAGTPKTGSSSIQKWLRLHVNALREDHGVHVLSETGGDGDEPYRFESFTRGLMVHANRFLVAYATIHDAGADAVRRAALCDQWAAALGDAARRHGRVLLTAEGFAVLFHRPELPFLHALERLAREHTVRVAYYVRPQHTAIEARWREWGFRTGMEPSAWAAKEADDLCYWETYAQVREIAPSVRFAVRPFRRDLLAAGDVIVDFATHFLGFAQAPDTRGLWENPGLPIDLVTLLRGAPAELLDRPAAPREGWRQGVLGPIAQGWAVPESPGSGEARELLRRYAYARYEVSNLRLVAELGWPTEHFVPGPAPDGDAADLGALDRLWAPRADATALAYLYAALGAMWEHYARSREPAPAATVRDGP